MNKSVIRFLVLSVSLYLLWFAAYEFYLKPAGKIDHILTENISYIVCYLLNLSDLEAYYTIGAKLGETYVFLGQDILPVVRIGSSCNGLEMLMIFSIFILCYPGNPLFKVIYILSGMLMIHVLNIFRNYVLTVLAINHSQFFELFHRYIFIFLIYGIIFLMWMWWANTVSKLEIERAK